MSEKTFHEGSSAFFQNPSHFAIHNPTMIHHVHQSSELLLMDKLDKETLRGAEFDSSERYPPPSCHPGTRIDISDQIYAWMHNPSREKPLLWLNGPAGVGKSAIMQTTAESDADSSASIIGATLFFSRPNKRDDPQRVFNTIAHQLAFKFPVYLQYILGLLAANPMTAQKSMVEQFRKFIVEPLGNKKLFNGLHDTVVILIDGLDECNGEWAQREIISLIAGFILQYSDTPLIWIIASRPEYQLQVSFLSKKVQPACLTLTVPINSDQACKDVELFLREKFSEIREQFPSSFSSSQQWPLELHFTKIANRASGLFIFASIVIRFIGDVNYGNPISQLSRVLAVIDSTPSSELNNHPFATLDCLYTEIMSSIPEDVYGTTNLILMYMLLGGLSRWPLPLSSSFFGLTQADVYGALRRLHSVLQVPDPYVNPNGKILAYHASFTDFLGSPSRSGKYYLHCSGETQDCYSRAVNRIIKESYYEAEPTTRISQISISWPRVEEKESRARLFTEAFRAFIRMVQESYPPSREYSLMTDGINVPAFFKDLDFSKLINICHSNIMGVLITLLQPPHFSCLDKWGIAKAIPISSLDVGSLPMHSPIYVSRVGGIANGFSMAKAEIEILIVQSDYTIPLSNKQFVYAGIVSPWSHPEIRTRFVTPALEDDTEWRIHILERLSKVRATIPNHPVMLFGKGLKCCAYVVVGEGIDLVENARDVESEEKREAVQSKEEIDDTDKNAEKRKEIWIYIFPYNSGDLY